MANEPIQSAAPIAASADPAPAAAPVASAAVDSPAPATAESAAPAAEVVTTFLDKAPETPAAEASAAPEKSVDPAPPISPEKPAEGDKTPEAPKDEGDKTAEPAPLPVYEPWTLPENVTLDEKLSGEFNNLLGEFQSTTKADQAYVQKFGQTLVDKHIAGLNDAVTRRDAAYTAAWQNQTDGWRESFIRDPEIGGKRQETTVRLANEFIDTHGGTDEQKEAFRAVMKQTGLGVHPEVLRLLSNAMNKYSEGRPLPANPPSNRFVSRPQKMYGPKTS